MKDIMKLIDALRYYEEDMFRLKHSSLANEIELLLIALNSEYVRIGLQIGRLLNNGYTSSQLKFILAARGFSVIKQIMANDNEVHGFKMLAKMEQAGQDITFETFSNMMKYVRKGV